MTEPTPPVLQGPSSKEKKYDRQLRLWAASGQAALEAAHVLLVNSGPGVVGVETLKNLILPGIGQFTILDSSLVTEADLGVNFFLEDEDVGKFRAEQTCRLLEELNPDVKGHAIPEPVESFLLDPGALRPFSLILVAAPIEPQLLNMIIEHTSSASTPAFYIHSIGFYSSFSVHLPSAFPVVDTHPDPTTTSDLRVLAPWPALAELAASKTKDLDAMTDHDHGHVPYLLLLLYYLQRWKETHDDQVPQNFKEKTAFRDFVRAGTRTGHPEGGEENFDEAVGAVIKALNPPSVSGAVREVFEAEECRNLTAKSSSFWIIAHTISAFYTKHGVLPLPGSLPDMKAQSADYIELQNLYKAKARADFADVLATVRKLEAEIPFEVPKIETKEVEAFCKGAAHIRLVRGRLFNIVQKGEKKVDWGDRAKALASTLTFPDAPIILHLAFLSFDAFTASHSADAQLSAMLPPGASSYPPDVEADSRKTIGIAHALLDSLLNAASTTLDDPEYSEVKETLGKHVEEIVRAGGAELHNIAALTGGLVAQEAIKVITKQYVPLDNTVVFDGIRSSTGVLRV